jgi:hypothetical protein
MKLMLVKDGPNSIRKISDS